MPTAAKEDAADKPETKPMWLDAWVNRLACVAATSACMDTADLDGSEDYKLVTADGSRRMRVFGGMQLLADVELLDVPCAICAVYLETPEPVRRPCIAVACGPFVFVYRNLRPYYKFALPPVDIHPDEAAVWQQLADGSLAVPAAVERLEQAREHGTALSARSLDLLSLPTPGDQALLVSRVKGTPLVQHTVITTMTVIKKDSDAPTATGCLVLGTEAAQLLILSPSCDAVLRAATLPAVPVFCVAAGILDVESRVIAACRDGRVYTLKNGGVVSTAVDLDAQPAALARVEKALWVATMAPALHSFHVKGRRLHCLPLPAPVFAMAAVSAEAQRGSRAVAVALGNGELRMYSGKSLLQTIRVGDTVVGMRFCRYGREDASLVCTTRSGALHIKLLSRLASFDPPRVAASAEDAAPLNIPKRSRWHAEQTAREQAHAVDMHRVFQRDLCRLRLATARAYVRVLTDGAGPLAYGMGTSLRVSAAVQGLGPAFCVQLTLHNTGQAALVDLRAVLSHDPALYSIATPVVAIPLVLPALPLTLDVAVLSLSDAADAIRIILLQGTSRVPVVTAVVTMPTPDMLGAGDG